MILLPDTDVWIRFLNPGSNRVKERFLSVAPQSIRLCSVVKAELYYGALKSRHKRENLALLDDLFADISSLPFDAGSARTYGEIRATLERQGSPLGPYDLMIAAIALEHGAVVVTHNTRDFMRVAGLMLEDWEL